MVNYKNIIACIVIIALHETASAVISPKGILINDFLVNDDSLGKGAMCYKPKIAIGSNGDFWVSWYDYRAEDWDIYAQLFKNNGIPKKYSFRVNDDPGTAYNVKQDIDISKTGNVCIVWEDYRNGKADVYAQIYDTSGIACGENIKINSDASKATDPCVALDLSGNILISWIDSSNSGINVKVKTLNSIGIPYSGEIAVDNDTVGVDHLAPEIAIGKNGSFCIAWQNINSSGKYDIIAQRFDSIGLAQGSNFRVNDETPIRYNFEPAIAMDTASHICITWMDCRNGNPDIYFQLFNEYGVPQGANIKVNNNTGSSMQWKPFIGMDKTGNFLITWEDGRNGNLDIFAQRYNASGVAQGTNFKVNSNPGTTDEVCPAITISDEGNAIISWEATYYNDIYFQRFDATGATQGVNTKIDENGTTVQYYPSVAVSANGYVGIVWMDRRNGNEDIYMQMYDNYGSKLCYNVKVNDDGGTATQSNPSCHFNSLNELIVTWQDWRNSNWDIYLQKYSSGATPQGINIKVNDDPGGYTQANPNIKVKYNDEFLVVWSDNRNGNSDIYAQRYNSSSVPYGSNVKINKDTTTINQYYPLVASDTTDRLCITWRENNLIAQYFDHDLNNISDTLILNDTLSDIWSHSMSMSLDGTLCVSWVDRRSGNWDVYTQRMNKSAQRLGENNKVNDDMGASTQSNSSVVYKPDGESYVISWIDYRKASDDPEVMCQYYNNEGNKIGDNVLLYNDSLVWWRQYYSINGASCNDDKMAFTWWDTRRGKNWDIYCKILDWDYTGVGGYITESKKNNNNFLNIYPNPFSHKTNITFIIRNV